MKTRISMAGGAVLLLAVAYVHGQQFGNQPAKLDLIKVKDDLFVIYNPFVPGNTTALVTGEGVVLVDDKFEVDAPNILAMLKTVCGVWQDASDRIVLAAPGDINRYPEKRARYAKVSDDEWTVGQKHCFVMDLR